MKVCYVCCFLWCGIQEFQGFVSLKEFDGGNDNLFLYGVLLLVLRRVSLADFQRDWKTPLT